jgi:hypothetical protein
VLLPIKLLNGSERDIDTIVFWKIAVLILLVVFDYEYSLKVHDQKAANKMTFYATRKSFDFLMIKY